MTGPDDDEQARSGPRDASFSDAYSPMRLAARDAEDLAVLSALLQDAVVMTGDQAWLAKERRFAFVANRYRWEDPDARERVRAGAHFNLVLNVRSKGVDATVKDQPLSILAMSFAPADAPPGGVVRIEFSGEASVELEVEDIDAAMRDLSQPWAARRRPDHGVDDDAAG